MKNSKVSIIVPVFNIDKYLERCIQSLLQQTYKNYEIILVDDGSTDTSAKICDKYASQNKNITVIHKSNSGLGMARNTGIENASGDLIKFIDGDDYIEKNHLENLINLVNEKSADAVLCGYTRVFKNGSAQKHKHIYSGKTFEGSQIINNVIPKLCGKKPDKSDNIEMSVWGAIFRANLISDNNIKFVSEREFISEDLIFDLDYLKYANKISFSDDIGYNYCDNEGSLTTSYRADRFEKQKKLEKVVTEKVKSYGIYNLCEQRIYNTLISIARYSIKLEQKFSKENGFLISMKNIRKICTDKELKIVFKKYDDQGASLKNKIVNFMVKHDWYVILWFVMLIKNKFDI